MEQIFNRIEKDDTEEVCLINNAGALSPIKLLHETKTNEIKLNITINLIAPLVITAEFLKLTKSMKTVKQFSICRAVSPVHLGHSGHIITAVTRA